MKHYYCCFIIMVFLLSIMIPAQVSNTGKNPKKKPAAERTSGKKSGGKSDSFFKKGNAFLSKGDTLAAVEEYTKAIESDGKNSAALKMRGLLNCHLGNYKSAIDDLTTVITNVNIDAEMFYTRGLARHLLLGDPGVMSFTSDGISGTMNINNEASNAWNSGYV